MDTTDKRTDPVDCGPRISDWRLRSNRRQADRDKLIALAEIHRDRARQRESQNSIRGVAPSAPQVGDQEGLYNRPIDAEKASKSAGLKGQEKRLKRPKVLDTDEAKWLSDMGKLGSAQRTFNPLVAGSNPARPTNKHKESPLRKT